MPNLAQMSLKIPDPKLELSGKLNQKLLHHAKKFANKKIELRKFQEIPKERYMSLEERQKVILIKD